MRVPFYLPKGWRMCIGSINSFLPQNRVAIVAKGKEKITDETVSAMKLSQLVIAVDGGLNFCYKHQVQAKYLIGDLDSVDKSLINKCKHLKIISLERAKDISDLEAAIQLAYKLDSTAIPCIFNALGGRKDHHLSNLYLLLKYPKAIIVTKDAFVRRATIHSPIKVESSFYQQILFAYYGDSHLKIGSKKVFLKRGSQFRLTEKTHPIQIQNGEMFLVSKKAPSFSSNADIFPLENITFPYSDANEDIFLLNSGNPSIELKTKVGLTISLIPWLGKAKGIQTEGLKWNLQGDEMHKEFIGISNIALTDHVKISVTSENLLCIVEKKVIDREMVGLEDPSSTKKFTMRSKL